MTSPAPRTLAHMLRGMSDDDLASLLIDRPDLAEPPPADFGQLASRATTMHSVEHALTLLNAYELAVLAYAVSLGRSFDRSSVEEYGGREAVDRLTGLALLWGGERLSPVRVLAPLLENHSPELPAPSAPVVDVEVSEVGYVDKVAAGSAFELVRRIEVLLEHWDHAPPRLLSTGSVGSRDTRAAGQLLDVTPTLAGQHIALAVGAGLVGYAAEGMHEIWIPSFAFDAWQQQPLAEQWATLVRSWYLGDDAGPSWLKQSIWDAFESYPAGAVLDSTVLTEWLEWTEPRRAASAGRQVPKVLDQAAWIGLIGLGALASFATDPAEVESVNALARLMPPRVSEILIQADLTAVAPGPLEPADARVLNVMADVESRGGASVHRFTPDSLRHASSLGWTPQAMLERLSAMSRTPIPQPLRYLIEDLNRTRPVTAPDVVSHAPRSARRGKALPSYDESAASPADVPAVIKQLRQAEQPREAGASRPSYAPSLGIDSPLDVLRQAAETGDLVWFGYVDKAGATTERLVRPLTVEEGVLQARDERTAEVARYPIHRITQAHVVRSGSG